MRKLTLPMVPVTIRVEQDDGSIKIEPRTPGWLLAQILASPNLTFAQVAKRLPIHDKLVNGKTTILLEEDQWTELTGAINTATGLSLNRDAHSIYRAALDAQEVTVEEKAEGPNRAAKRRAKMAAK